MAHPGNGTYKLVASSGEYASMTVTSTGATTAVPGGNWTWDSLSDWFKHDDLDIWIRFVDLYDPGPPEVLGTFVAVVNPGPDEKGYSGTYGP